MDAADHIPTLVPTLEDAVALAAQAHRGQVYPSLSGEPFILHPLRVMLRVASDDERIAAVLHDVIEDTACTLDDLRRAGYGEHIIAALDHLTHRDDETYAAYIERVKDDLLARRVKLADLAENLANNRRIAETTTSPELRARITRYERAIATLKAAAAAETAPDTA
ncbi:MAG TPA: HD domain-containing protein [Ktedonobacterales bacterium]